MKNTPKSKHPMTELERRKLEMIEQIKAQIDAKYGDTNKRHKDEETSAGDDDDAGRSPRDK